MNKFALGLLSAAALATTFLLVRQQREVHREWDSKRPRVASGETQPQHLSIERIRELGL
jgi:hypothetical protein